MMLTRYLLSFAILLPLAIPAPARNVSLADDRADVVAIEKYIRTELYFGRNKPSGGTVSVEEWRRFVDEFVTPRFPDGLTILEANGQWRGKDGIIAREQSMVVVLLYSRKDRKAANAKIEEIRAEYKKRFEQESVLRLDFRTSVRVTF